MKRVLLTGGSGSVGIHFIAHILHNTDWFIVIVASFRHRGDFDKIVTMVEDHPTWAGRITIVYHDLVAPFSEREIKDFSNIDYILNLASLSDVQSSIDDPVPFIRNNTELILTMLELSRRLKPEVFLQFSTDEVMGPADKNQAHKEWSPILPSNPYAASKAAQEAIAISYWRSYGVPLVITNTQNNFGEMQQPEKYPVKIQKAIQAGGEVIVHTSSDGAIGTRYYIHSRNVADAVLFLLRNTKPYIHKPGYIDRPDRYNIVDEVQLDNLQLAKVIAKLMGKKLKYRLVDFHSTNPGHDVNYGIDGTKIRELGWKPPVPFEESLKKTIDWQLEHPEWIA